jgi:hypothetical protein
MEEFSIRGFEVVSSARLTFLGIAIENGWHEFAKINPFTNGLQF